MKLFLRWLIRALAGFPVPRLLAAKDREISGLRERVTSLEAVIADLTAYNRRLVDAALITKGHLPVERDVDSHPPVVADNPYSDDEWEVKAEMQEIEAKAQQAAGDDFYFDIAKESADVDANWVPVYQRAVEIRRQRN